MTDSADWLSHAAKAPFCLSFGFSHADVLFVLHLEDGRLLYVTLAILLKNAHVEVDAAKIQATFAQLAPHRLFKVRLSFLPPPWLRELRCDSLEGRARRR